MYLHITSQSIILFIVLETIKYFPLNLAPTNSLARKGEFKMMSVADSDNLQNLLANLNLDMSSGLNNDKKVEKLVLQLGELSARYSDLASRYLKLVNSKVNEPIKSSFQDSFENHQSSQVTGLQKSFLDTLAVIVFVSNHLNCQFRNIRSKFRTALLPVNLTPLLESLLVI